MGRGFGGGGVKDVGGEGWVLDWIVSGWGGYWVGLGCGGVEWSLWWFGRLDGIGEGRIGEDGR